MKKGHIIPIQVIPKWIFVKTNLGFSTLESHLKFKDEKGNIEGRNQLFTTYTLT